MPDPECPRERLLAYHLNAGIERQGAGVNEEDEPIELSLAEIDDLSMQAIDQITGRLPVRDYRTPQADDGSSSPIMEFGYGARFEVIYDREEIGRAGPLTLGPTGCASNVWLATSSSAARRHDGSINPHAVLPEQRGMTQAHLALWSR